MQSVYAITQAEFLNKTFNTNYKKYNKPIWKHSNGTVVWMFCADGKAHKGCKVSVGEDIIIEKYYGLSGRRFKSGYNLAPVRTAVRIVLSRVTELPFMFEILGTYTLSLTESELGVHHVWRKYGAIQKKTTYYN